MAETVFQYEYLTQSGEKKCFRIMTGSITELAGYDIAVCSAYQGNYYPLRGTLIGAMLKDNGVSVEELSKDPEVQLSRSYCWLSRALDAPYRRVACVEITSLGNYKQNVAIMDALLKRSFSALRMILEEAELSGIPVGRVVLPILGTGSQMLRVEEVAGPLIKQLLYAFETVEGLHEVTVCEYSQEKAELLAMMVGEILDHGKKSSPDVFISYSSRQLKEATVIRDALLQVGISCWMAPDSIPKGSQYWKEIPIALANTKVLVLLLTPDAESSLWVPKELNTAIENRNVIIPFQPFDYPNGTAFRFILSDIQILRAWEFPEETRLDRLVFEVMRSLAKI